MCVRRAWLAPDRNSSEFTFVFAAFWSDGGTMSEKDGSEIAPSTAAMLNRVSAADLLFTVRCVSAISTI
jgi:hypothetical protein